MPKCLTLNLKLNNLCLGLYISVLEILYKLLSSDLTVVVSFSCPWPKDITIVLLRKLPSIISLSKGIDAALDPAPHIITPVQIISWASKNSFPSIYSILFFSFFFIMIHVYKLKCNAVASIGNY